MYTIKQKKRITYKQETKRNTEQAGRKKFTTNVDLTEEEYARFACQSMSFCLTASVTVTHTVMFIYAPCTNLHKTNNLTEFCWNFVKFVIFLLELDHFHV